MKRSSRLVWLGVGLLSVLPLTASAQGPSARPPRPNILIAIADDWSWPHAGAYGDHTVATPTFDRVAKEGARFTHAFTMAPSCTPSRAALLTGQASHRLAEGGNLHGFLPAQFAVYPDLLEAAGYFVGFTRKGWGPGRFEPGGRARNPAGPQFAGFDEFMKQRPAGRPFSFWFGSHDPHRPYDKGSGLKAGLKLESVVVPPFLPDTPEVRSDLLDYYLEVQRFDREVGEILDKLAATGELDNTLVVVTSDNGMPFPRAKANVYDAGVRMPLAVRWPARVPAGRVIDAFVSHTDLAPTFLEAAGLRPPDRMTGRSLLPLLRGARVTGRDRVFVERERHANVRQGDLSYPMRAVRTRDFLYIRNFRPDRWPAGDPEKYVAVGPFGDIDDGPTKRLLLSGRADAAIATSFQLATAKRPAEELYDLRRDPWQMANVADEARHARVKKDLRAALDGWMRQTGDPRATSDADPWDRYPYYGQPGPPERFIAPRPPQAKAPPNILLIVSDDHAWSDYGFMGHPVVRTPSLDRLAAEGMTYTRGYVPTSLCRPSLATIVTGLYPHQHGITGNDPPGGSAAMFDPARRATMVEIFKRNRALPALLAEKGYVSFQSGKWWEGRPQDSGFTAAMTHGDVARRGRHGDEGLKIGREGLQPIYDFIDSSEGKPFFVWYAPMMPHAPHTPPDRLLKKYQTSDLAPPIARYYAMIEWLDETVGQLLDHLDRTGLRDNTIVMYLADNGWIQSPDPKPEQPTRAKMSPYDAGLRTPVIIRWPGRVDPKRDEKTLVESIDVMPTLLRAAGITPSPDLPGIDLLDSRALAGRTTLFGSLFVHTAVDVASPAANLKYRYAIREDGWKLILPFTPNRDATLMIDGRTADWMRFEPELYNVLADPREATNRAAEQPDLVKALRAAIDGWWRVPR